MTQMTVKAIQAIQDSIAVWVRKRDNPNPFDIKIGMTNCPLCAAFARTVFAGMQTSCGDCPVKKHTEQDGCHGTPYFVAASSLDYWRYAKMQERHTEDEGATRQARNSWRHDAQQEIRFLRSLLPKRLRWTVSTKGTRHD